MPFFIFELYLSLDQKTRTQLDKTLTQAKSFSILLQLTGRFPTYTEILNSAGLQTFIQKEYTSKYIGNFEKH